MKILKTSIVLALLALTLTSFSECKGNSNEIGEKSPPMEIREIYYQRWISGVEGGGSGINLFIDLEETVLILDSVYFRERALKLERRDTLRYIGRLKTFTNSDDSPDNTRMRHLNLNDDECIISYIDGDKRGYFTVREIPEKPPVSFPSIRPDKQ